MKAARKVKVKVKEKKRQKGQTDSNPPLEVGAATGRQK
jgi:hypothetical protein